MKDLPEIARHTKALRYSRKERLHFWLFRRWPESVVQRRLAADDADRREAREWAAAYARERRKSA